MYCTPARSLFAMKEKKPSLAAETPFALQPRSVSYQTDSVLSCWYSL